MKWYLSSIFPLSSIVSLRRNGGCCQRGLGVLMVYVYEGVTSQGWQNALCYSFGGPLWQQRC